MKASILLFSVLVILVVLALGEAKKKKKEAGPCAVKDCKKCNLTGKKCKVCIEGYKPKKKGKKCAPKPCYVNPCENEGECKYNKKKKTETCTCLEGFFGDKCEISAQVEPAIDPAPTELAPVDPIPVEPATFDHVDPIPVEPATFDHVDPIPVEPATFDHVDPVPQSEPVGFELITEESEGVATSCSHLGGGKISGGVEGCKKLCRETDNCNAFNYKDDTCYVKRCDDCDAKPSTKWGGWNIYMAEKLDCGEKEEFVLAKASTEPGASRCRHLGTYRNKSLDECKDQCRDRPICDTMNFCDQGGRCGLGECNLKSCNSGSGGGDTQIGNSGYKGWAVWTRS